MGYHNEYGPGTITLEEWKRQQEEVSEVELVIRHRKSTSEKQD